MPRWHGPCAGAERLRAFLRAIKRPFALSLSKCPCILSRSKGLSLSKCPRILRLSMGLSLSKCPCILSLSKGLSLSKCPCILSLSKCPCILSLSKCPPTRCKASFDKLRTIGKTSSAPSTGSGPAGAPFDKLRTIGNTSSAPSTGSGPAGASTSSARTGVECARRKTLRLCSARCSSAQRPFANSRNGPRADVPTRSIGFISAVVLHARTHIDKQRAECGDHAAAGDDAPAQRAVGSLHRQFQFHAYQPPVDQGPD